MIEIRTRDLDLKTQVGDKEVSTVALTIEHFGGMWYETMIFSCNESGEVASFVELYCDRYATREQAEDGHTRTVEALRAGTLDLYKPDDDD